MKREILINEQYYHVFNKSIAGYKIFNNELEFGRFMSVIKYYQHDDVKLSYSKLLELSIADQSGVISSISNNDKLIEIVAYCIMPTHFHLLLKQLENNGIQKFISNICNSYTHYFNLNHNRKGPLWQGRFKNVLVENDEQLIHLTRYIHLNPAASGLINNPIEWEYSSYREYLNETDNKLCNFDILDIKPGVYKRFVLSQKNYQKELYLIKKQIVE